MNAPQISPQRAEWILFKGTFCRHRSNDSNEPIISHTTAGQLEMSRAASTPSPCGLFRAAPDEILFSPESLAHRAQSKIKQAGRQAGRDDTETQCVWKTSLRTLTPSFYSTSHAAPENQTRPLTAYCTVD